MDDVALPTILRCARCNKPFDKEATLKRHGYYCRSRDGPVVPRTRSCVACAGGKARCDGKRPSCGRCLSKKLDCQYSERTRKGRRFDGDTSGHPFEVPTSIDIAEDIPFQLHNDLDLQWPDMSLDLDEVPDWGNSFISDAPLKEHAAFPRLGPLMFARNPPPVFHSVESLLANNIALPMQPTQTVRTLATRQRANPATSRISGLILSILKSYPLMLLRHNSLPPFIHLQWLNTDSDQGQLEALTNCISLMHMLSSGGMSSSKLFWKNVRLECEQLRINCEKLTRWGLVAAMQALSIYLLVRVGEGETEHNNLDALLLAAVTMISKEFMKRQMTCSDYDDRKCASDEARWEDWIFQESQRRICVVYQVVGLLVHFEPAVLCDLKTELVLAPLPSRSQLWEAKDEQSWSSEERVGSHIDFGLASDGQLVEVDLEQLYAGSGERLDLPARKVANWEDWCAGTDGLGTLIMLTASLIA